MKNYYIVSQKSNLTKKIDKLINELISSNSTSFAVVDIDFNQKEKLILAKKGDVNYTLMNHVDLDLFSYFMKVHLTKGKNLTELIVVEDITKLNKKEMDYFEKNIKNLNSENIFIIFCSDKKSDSKFINYYFINY